MHTDDVAKAEMLYVICVHNFTNYLIANRYW